ncbi:MAG TPA: hypothetical protein VMU89_07995 [Thermomicrobiaceae bacterium]|nr:hypothetical protein [Thermomicrobiaceae bacterium]
MRYAHVSVSAASMLAACGGSPVLGSDPKLELLQDFGKYVQTIGYPGPPTAAAGQVNNTYVIPDMFAKACTGMSADDAMSWAEQQIQSIYAKYPTT